MILDALLLEAILLLACSLGLGAWQRDPSTMGRLTFCALCAAVMATTLGELLQLREIAPETIADPIKYAGLLALAPLWVGFTAHVSGLEVARRIPWFPALLLLPGVFLFALMLDDRYAVLFLRSVEGGRDEFGGLWWASLYYNEVLAVVGSAILARGVGVSGREIGQTVRRLVLLAASLLPPIGNALYIASDFDWPYDPTPLLLGLTLLAVRSAVFEGALVEPLPITQRELIHQLPLGVIVADRNGNIVEMSDAAGNRLGVFEEYAVGRSLDEVLAWCEPTPLRTCDLLRRGRPAGRLVLLE
jgi:PAS domain-containing protein